MDILRQLIGLELAVEDDGDCVDRGLFAASARTSLAFLEVRNLHVQGLGQFLGRDESLAAIVSNVAKVRLAERTLLQQNEDARFETIYVRLGIYFYFVVIDWTFGYCSDIE